MFTIVIITTSVFVACAWAWAIWEMSNAEKKDNEDDEEDRTD